MPGEVITTQAGSFANYVGAHYWNIQVLSVIIWGLAIRDWNLTPPRSVLT